MSNDDQWPRIDYKFKNNSVRVQRAGRHSDTTQLKLLAILLAVLIVSEIVNIALWILSKVTP